MGGGGGDEEKGAKKEEKEVIGITVEDCFFIIDYCIHRLHHSSYIISIDKQARPGNDASGLCLCLY